MQRNQQALLVALGILIGMVVGLYTYSFSPIFLGLASVMGAGVGMLVGNRIYQRRKAQATANHRLDLLTGDLTHTRSGTTKIDGSTTASAEKNAPVSQ